jgi:regulatory protein
VAEVRARLQREELPQTAADTAIAQLTASALLDDARYARLFVEDKRSLAGWGRERIERSLSERGIATEVIAAAITAGDRAQGAGLGERERALDVLRRRFPRSSSDPRELDRALRVLVRKGYGSEVAYDAVRLWSKTASSD